MSDLERIEQGIHIPKDKLDSWSKQKYLARAFDCLIANEDRTQQNIRYTQDWRTILIDHSRFEDLQELADAYMLLCGALWDALIQQKCIAALIISSNHHHLSRTLKSFGFFHVTRGAAFMVNDFSGKERMLPPLTRPFHINPSESFGYP